MIFSMRGINNGHNNPLMEDKSHSVQQCHGILLNSCFFKTHKSKLPSSMFNFEAFLNAGET